MSFLFGLFHMNVFQFLPSFVLGVVLGLLTVRSGSVLPAMLFHFLYNAALLTSAPIKRALVETNLLSYGPVVIVICLTIACSLLWWLYRQPNVELEPAERKV